MTVAKVEGANDSVVRCQWFAGGELRDGMFTPATLVDVPKGLPLGDTMYAGGEAVERQPVLRSLRSARTCATEGCGNNSGSFHYCKPCQEEHGSR